jgi:hypothetical protein
MMTVAGATYQTDRGMAVFIVLMLLFAMIHIILHCIANKMWTKTAEANTLSSRREIVGDRKETAIFSCAFVV